MTDLARLGIEIDSREVKTGVSELDKLTAAGTRAEKAVDRLGDKSVEAGRQLKGAGAAASEMAREAQRAAMGVEATGKASGLAWHHVQNLSFQANDLFVGLASGQKPMTVFIQQGAQIGQIMAQAGVGIGAATKQLLAMGGAALAANPLLLGIAVAAGTASAAIGIMTADMNENSKVTLTWGDVALGTFDAVAAYLNNQLGEAYKALGFTAEEAWKSTVSAAKWALNYMIGASTIAHRSIIAGFSTLPGAIGDAFYAATNVAIMAIEALVNRALKGIGAVIVAVNPLLAAASMAGLGPSMPQIALGRVSNPYAGGMAKAGNAMIGAVKDTFTRDFLGEAADYISPFANARARERLKSDAKKAGSEAGKAGGKEAGINWAQEYLNALGAFDPDVQKRLQGMYAQTEADLADIKARGTDAFNQTYQAVNDNIAATMDWNDQLVQTAYLFDQIGGAGKGVAQVLNILAGNYGAVNGPLGVFAQSLANVSWTTAASDGGRPIIHRLGEEFSSALDKVFGNNGTFSKLLQGGQLGMATGSLLFGNNQGAQIGGMIGGSLGSLLGPIGNIVGSIIGSTLGKLFGGGAKYGSAVVGANGVTVGGNNDNSKGAATGAGGAVSDAIGAIAQALGGTVGNYAVSIGETDGKWRISTTGRSGELKSKYSDVQVFGKGDAAAEAALKAAIADAIKDGAIQGVSAAVGRLLQSGGDIDKQVSKAQLFQSVFKELKAQTDPLGSALDDLGTQFNALKAIFDEAGASAAEYASLEQLLALKREEAVDAARQSKVDKITDQFELQIRALELIGNSEAALAASRMLELAGTKATLQPIRQFVYQLEDARAVMDQFGPLAEDLRSYRKELVGTSSVASYGAARALFASTAASAAMGDAVALGGLRGVSDSYLASAKANARSSLDYNRARGQVLAAVDQGIFAADTKVDYAQAQIDAINNSAQIMERMRAEMVDLQTQVASNTSFMANLWKRFDGEGILVRTDSDTPLNVVTA